MDGRARHECGGTGHVKHPPAGDVRSRLAGIVLAGHAVSIVDPDGRDDNNRCERWRQLANVTMFWSRIIWSVWSEEVRPGMRTSGTPLPSAASKSAVLAT
jgi:hypothetical protein